MATYFSKAFLEILHAFSHPTHFQKYLAPLFHFNLVVGGVTFSDWRCDYYFSINNFDECASTNVYLLTITPHA